MVLGPCRSPDLLRFPQRVRQACRNDDDAVGREGLPGSLTDTKATGATQDVVDRDGLERTELQLPSALDAADREGAEAYGQRHQEAIKEIRLHAVAPVSVVGPVRNLPVDSNFSRSVVVR